MQWFGKVCNNSEVSDKIILLCFISGIDAVSQVQQMIGATDPLKSSAGTIRGDFSLDPDHNICDGLFFSFYITIFN